MVETDSESRKVNEGFRATERAQLEADGMDCHSCPKQHESVTVSCNAWQMESRSRENIPRWCIRLGD